MKRVLLFALLISVGSVVDASAQDEPASPVLFSYFTGNGEDGLHLAYSEDGHTFTALNDGQPLLAPTVGEQQLMRDPSITRGPDGRFHMVWTTGWSGTTIGYAHSADLIHWSEQRATRPFPDSVDVRNCWAPEIYYDAASDQFVVVWASTIQGRFPETLGEGHDGLNHRLYAVTTADFDRISDPQLFYEPGFQVIDGALFRTEARHAMVVKDETLNPEPAKHLFLVFADTATGPWSEPTAPITGDYWAEGPAPLQVGDWWYIYFDKYRQGQFGAVRSKNLDRWEDVSDRITFPDGARHGTAFYVPPAVLDRLKALSP